MALLTPTQVAQQQAIAEGFQGGPIPTVNPVNISTQATLGNSVPSIAEPTPYYPPATFLTPNLGLSLQGLDPIVAEDMVAIDTAFASSGGSGLPNKPASIVTKVANYQPAQTDGTILCNGTFTITLVTTLILGTTFRIKNIGAGSITLSSAVNIDFAATFILNPYPGMSVDVQWDGTQWWIL